MKRSESKKLIPLYLQQLFLERTDSTHYIRMADILSFLETKGVYADRRTIYADISILNSAGFEVIGVQEKGNYKYHHPVRLFDTNELKFLIDSIATSKFLTEKKSKELIDKVKRLGSSHEGRSINRNVLLDRRVKSMNDSVFKNLDHIYAAIESNRQITFRYLKWDTKKRLVPRSEKTYIASPYAVSLTDDNYYLIAFDGRADDLRHYRIDKMQSVNVTGDMREGKSLFQSFNIVDYSKKTFGMFGGKEETVGIKVVNSLVGVFIDRFGEAVSIRPDLDDPDACIVRVAVNVSPQFFAWLFGLGTGVEILSPGSVKTDFINMVRDILKKYECR